MLALLLAWSAATIAPQAPGGEPDSLSRVALHRALDAFSDAFLRADAAALDTLIVAGYRHTNGGTGSMLGKADWLDYVRARRKDLDSGRLEVRRYEVVDMAITWHPGAAVVTNRVVSEGTQDGAGFASRLQVTQVWIREGRQWRRAAFHDSPTRPPGS